MSRMKCVCLLGISVLALLQQHAVADPERPAARQRISDASATYDNQKILFQIEFSNPFVTSHWEFQVFVDTDNNPSTGYGLGWEVLIRGLDLPSKRGLVELRSTACSPGHEHGSPECPGGWGGLLQIVEFERVTAHDILVVVPLSDTGIPGGPMRFAVEAYYDDSLVDGRYDVPARSSDGTISVPAPESIVKPSLPVAERKSDEPQKREHADTDPAETLQKTPEKPDKPTD